MGLAPDDLWRKAVMRAAVFIGECGAVIHPWKLHLDSFKKVRNFEVRSDVSIDR